MILECSLWFFLRRDPTATASSYRDSSRSGCATSLFAKASIPSPSATRFVSKLTSECRATGAVGAEGFGSCNQAQAARRVNVVRIRIFMGGLANRFSGSSGVVSH